MPGYEVSRKLEKMGWHASDTGELSFTDVEVPDENLLGEENRGFYLIMANFPWERLLMALGAVGAMQPAARRRDRLRAASARRSAARSGSFQTIRHKIAEMGVKLEAGRALTYDALRQYAAGEDAIREVTMAKLFTQRACARGRRRVPPDPRRLRLHARVRRRARRARPPPRPDRRRHRGGHEGDPGPQLRALTSARRSFAIRRKRLAFEKFRRTPARRLSFGSSKPPMSLWGTSDEAFVVSHKVAANLEVLLPFEVGGVRVRDQARATLGDRKASRLGVDPDPAGSRGRA